MDDRRGPGHPVRRRIMGVAVAIALTTVLPLQYAVRAAQAPGDPVLLADVNKITFSSSVSNLVEVGGVLYFAADDGTHGTELWRSDGTDSGTVMVKDIVAGPGEGSGPSSLTNVGGTLFFTAEDADHGREVWSSDGTSQGTVLVADIMPGEGNGSEPSWLTNVGGTLMFTADDGRNGVELWSSNGTAAGTVMAADIRSGSTGSYPQNLVAVGASLYFTANDGVSGDELWSSNGTSAGTAMVRDIRPGGTSTSPANLTRLGGTLFFVADDGVAGAELWSSDGTSGGTALVEDINPGAPSSNPSSLKAVGGALYFTANDGLTGDELWRSDGTTGGTALVEDIWAGAQSSYPRRLADVGGTLYFGADDGVHGTELWRSDGTSAGTAMVKDVASGSAHSYPASIVRAGGTTYFVADDGTHGYELWRTDGLATGTAMVRDIHAGSERGLDPDTPVFAAMGGRLFFRATNAATGDELWVSDGTSSGTSQVLDVNPSTADSEPQSLVLAGPTMFLTMDDGEHGRELWKSDGSSAGTAMVKDICPGRSSSVRSASDADYDRATRPLAAVGSRVFLVANDCVNGDELWVSDGTGAGTTMVADLTAGAGNGSEITALTSLGSVLLFYARTTAEGWELWRSDGTAAGTSLVRDINPGGSDSIATTTEGRANFVFGDKVFFVARDGTHGYELWVSDGTAAGTAMVSDLAPGAGDSFNWTTRPAFAALGDHVYFTADPTGAGATLWRTDGTTAGTVAVAPSAGVTVGSQLLTMGSAVFFAGNDGVNGWELWRSDGTDSGTTMVRDLNPSGGSLDAAPLYRALFTDGGTLFFSADDGSMGVELWRSDGSADGTMVVGDIVPGSNGSRPQRFAVFGGVLYFGARDANDVENLLTFDGATVTRVTIGASQPVRPMWLTSMADSLFLSAVTLEEGREPWVFSLTAGPGTGASTTSTSTTVAAPGGGPGESSSEDAGDDGALPTSGAGFSLLSLATLFLLAGVALSARARGRRTSRPDVAIFH